ncbi:MAG TPA: class A beta-lactamase [Gemmatimonadaceae bacterium]|jgi:beta-lactamase class A|nr:class A beta-lactamase [Gemmatimonadaceae bacterium]
MTTNRRPSVARIHEATWRAVGALAVGALLSTSFVTAVEAQSQTRPAGQTTARDPMLGRLESEITRLAAIAGGKVGVAAVHLETGREVVLNRGEPFPMASVYKVPIAVQLLTRVDSGTLRLDSMITLRPSDLHPGSGTLTQLFDNPGVSLSVRNLLELMLLISDNSATDIMLRTAGGGAAVNARMRALDVSGISVDRPTLNLIADAIGVKNLPPEDKLTPEAFRELARGVSDDAEKAAAEAFYRDRRDTATPEGMARLLETIWRGRALSKANTDLLLDIMRRCETGENRIKGLLPPDVIVRHKTGTLGLGVANDVGIVELPNGAGHIALAIFVKESTRPTAMQERAIAQIARAAYDYFLFNPGTK